MFQACNIDWCFSKNFLIYVITTMTCGCSALILWRINFDIHTNISPEPTPFSHKNHSHVWKAQSVIERCVYRLFVWQSIEQAHARKRNTEYKAKSFLIEFTSLLLPSLCFRVNEKVLFARKGKKLLMFFYQLTSGGTLSKIMGYRDLRAVGMLLMFKFPPSLSPFNLLIAFY